MSYTNGFAKLLLGLSIVGLAGCDEPADADVDPVSEDQGYAPIDDDVTFRFVADNGIESNGFQLNGFRINGFRINGFLLGLVEAVVTSFSDLQFHSGSLLKAWHPDSGTYKIGAQLNGMSFNADFEVDGVPQVGTIRLVSVTQSSERPDVYFYNVQNYNNGAWTSACFDGAGNPTEAIAVQGTFDSATGARTSDVGLTWACRGAAIAKAIEWGYRPWVSATYKNYHQAAVRMIRADYCGTGEHHTSNGNPIDIADNLGIQSFDSSWNVEAAWGVNGAVCLNTPRKLYWPRSSINPCSSLPTCNANPLTNTGALLATKAVPNSN